MKAPLMLRIRTERGEKLFFYGQLILGLIYIVDIFGVITNNLLLMFTIASALGIVLILLVLTSYSYFNANITPERVVIGKLKIPLDQVMEIRILKSNDTTTNLIIVYEGGEITIEEVKNWKEVLETFQRYKENII
ncbi:DUF3093 domain-containing protein [Sulfolobus sp. S-194]|uniref:DUF3093 domain-containing protein n=1 Tax=Sulfolobus sp. S-194 TaxID=2512240 RepID=UPI00257024B9|nr:DUF3093 domain-containing protein [Sulfolobus sp. S-194]